jgi:hypothetical protein
MRWIAALLTFLPVLDASAGDWPLDERLTFDRACHVAVANGMLFLSTAHDKPMANYGGIRPGCWIAALPVGGIVLAPDLANLCACSYLNKASIALQPME